MSGPAVEALDLEGGLSVLSAQLTKVKSLKTKKLNTWRKTIERFKVDQNNQELWSALKLNREAAEEFGTAYEVLMEACMVKMQKELDRAEFGTVSPMIAKLAEADSLEILKLVEKVHDAANSLFVKRSNFYAVKRGGGEVESTYLARVRVLSDLAKIGEMDGKEQVKFKVITDLSTKTREKILRKLDITLDEMTVLIAEMEAMDIVNNTLKLDTPKVNPGQPASWKV